MKRLLYDDLRVLVAIRSAEDTAKKLAMNCNREFIDYYNHICPCCQKEMKMERHSNTVKNIGAIGIGVYKEIKLTIPYVLCKPCSKNTNAQKANIDNTENYILGKLGLLDTFGL